MVVSVGAKEEIMVVEVVNEVPEDRGLDMQVPVEVESWGKEVA